MSCRSLVVLTAVLFAGAVFVEGASLAELTARAASRDAACTPSGTRTVARSATARLLLRRGQLAACVIGDGRIENISAYTTGTLRGSLAAYPGVSYDGDGPDQVGSLAIYVRDLRRRRMLRVVEVPVQSHSAAEVASLALLRDGTVAWITCPPNRRDEPCASRGIRRVMLAPLDGPVRILSVSPSIRSRGLRFSDGGRVLRWRESDRSRSAPTGSIASS